MATGIGSWSTTAASNSNADSNINWAEGQAPSSVNDSARQMMKSLADWLRDAGWIEFKEYTCTYASATSVTVAGSNVTAYFPAGRPVRAVGSSTGTIYGRVRSSSFSTDTTINFDWDSGSLSNETLAISVSLLNFTGQPTPSDFVRAVNMSKAADVTASSSMNIWGVLGNSFNMPGTATVSAFNDAPRPGAFRVFRNTAAKTFINSGNLILPQGENFEAESGDMGFIWAEGTTTFVVNFFPRYPALDNIARDFRYYTSDASFSYASVIPSNVSHILVELWGGGGGGGGGHTTSIMRGAGGGGGGYSMKRIAVASLSAVTVITIGAGGSGSANGTSAVNGSAGATTAFGGHFSATGGGGGTFASGTSQAGGAGGAGADGDINLTGQTGALSSPQSGAGTLGEILFGFGGDGANGGAGGMSNVGVAGLAPGGGGSGGNHVAGSAGNGAAGAAKISW